MRAGTGVMRRGVVRVFGASALLLAALAASSPAAFAEPTKPAASPIYGVTIPPGYRKWELVAPAEEAAPLDELRVVLGNPVAIRALEQATLPFPDGTILVKLAYKRKQSDEFPCFRRPRKKICKKGLIASKRSSYNLFFPGNDQPGKCSKGRRGGRVVECT
ncbi:cytochrome P460 family protein [Burkholderia ubonensis]|uniref:cytochrome P460 family protein n=1 Tax=Burkholderia ubonensis TaxID=101571 RepID=UPI002114FB74|nr:cytochrome P460 family protein [Burkholderia ubonensis]